MTQTVVAALAAPSGAATMTQKVVAALGVFSLVFRRFEGPQEAEMGGSGPG